MMDILSYSRCKMA